MMISPQASAEDAAAKHAAQREMKALRARVSRLDANGLDLIFRGARSHHTWKPDAVSDADLHAIHELAKWGPTSTNGNPARFIFVRSVEPKQRLSECVAEGNIAKVLNAPVMAIIAFDLEWWRGLAHLFSHRDMSGPYRSNPVKAAETALRNGSLQGAYLMIAARALGFDIGGISGFDNAKVDQAFLSGTTFRSNFLCAIGHADEAGLFQRLPRYAFEEVCKIV